MSILRMAAVAAVLLSSSLLAQTKIGIVSLQKALGDTAEVKAAQAELEARYKPRSERLAQLQKELEKMQQEYEQNQSKYQPAALDELLTQMQRRQTQLQRQQQSFQDEVNRDRNDLLQKFGARMQDVLKKLAEDKGLDVIIDVSNLLYVKPAVDISAEATAAYDKAFPAKK